MRVTRDGRRRGVVRLAGVLAVLALVGAACGDDDDEDEATATTEETTEASEGDVAAFCQAIVTIDSFAEEPDVDFETATPEEIQAALQDFGAAFEPLLQRAEQTAPAEVEEDVSTLAGLARQATESGDDSVFESPEFVEGDRRIDKFMLAECGYEEIEATGVNYAFEGVPETVEAGPLAVTFTNEGTEFHELQFFRINDDVTESFEELLMLPEEEAMTKGVPASGAFAMPGQSDTVFLDLAAGRYGVACFIPVGLTPEAAEAAEEGEEPGGPPHFTEGMLAELTVE